MRLRDSITSQAVDRLAAEFEHTATLSSHFAAARELRALAGLLRRRGR